MVLKPMKMGANDDQDMVVIRLGDVAPRVPYQIALEISQGLRVGCKEAARFDRVSGQFWHELVTEDHRLDIPKAHRGFRRSMLVPNIKNYEVRVNSSLVILEFDGRNVEMNYEDGIKLHISIRKAALRAKAWAGDTSTSKRMLGTLHDAEEDYRLGLM